MLRLNRKLKPKIQDKRQSIPGIGIELFILVRLLWQVTGTPSINGCTQASQIPICDILLFIEEEIPKISGNIWKPQVKYSFFSFFFLGNFHFYSIQKRIGIKIFFFKLPTFHGYKPKYIAPLTPCILVHNFLVN